MTTKTKRRIRDPRLDPRPGDVVRNRIHDPATRTVTGRESYGRVRYSYNRGAFELLIWLYEWCEFGRGAEIVKRVKVTR